MNKRKTTIQIAEQLIVNTEKQPEAIHGVHDGYTILQKIINKQSDKETYYMERILNFIIKDRFNCEGYGIQSVWDNTINGVDEVPSSFLVRFTHKEEPQSEFSLEVDNEKVSIWGIAIGSNIKDALIFY